MWRRSVASVVRSRNMSSAAKKKRVGFSDALMTWVRQEDISQEFLLRADSLRALSSQSEYVAYRRRQIPIFRALERELDHQLEDKSSDAELKDFTSLTGAIGTLWRENESSLRRADSLQAEVDALTGGRKSFKTTLFTEDEVLSPAVRQYVRRIKAAADLDGDLLVGHVFARYYLCARVEPTHMFKTVGYSPPEIHEDAISTLFAAIDKIELPSDKRRAVEYEVARAFHLNAMIAEETPNTNWGAFKGLGKLFYATVTGSSTNRRRKQSDDAGRGAKNDEKDSPAA